MMTPAASCLSFLRQTSLLLMSLAALSGPASAQLINVNFEQYTPGLGTFAVESTLVGPAGGLGTQWNQFADEDSAGPLVDSTGAATTIEFTTNFSEGRSGGGGNTPMLRSTLTDFGRGAQRTLTITGLQAGEIYDVWLTSYRDSSSPRERTVGVWSTALPTDSPSSQIIDNRGSQNGTSFVDGYNYVVFRAVEANGSGQIIMNGNGADTSEGYDDDYRLGLSGFQISPGTPVEPLEITDFIYDEGTDEITVTWGSNPGEFYGLYWSEDLEEFSPAVNPAIPAAASGNRTTFGPFPNPFPAADTLFLAIGPPDLEDPVLGRVWGTGTTISINFSEPMADGTALDPANFSVSGGGGPVTVLTAEFSPGTDTILLTLDTALDPDTDYTVTTSNLTDVAGRSLSGAVGAGFRTWDDNGNGVKVFVLAGQSNMVGYGQSETGNGGVNGEVGSLRHLVTNDIPTYGHLLVDDTQPTTSDWATRSDVKVWWNRANPGQGNNILKGDLDIGFSSNSARIGPEYGFGWRLGDFHTNDVLLIKTAWGGKSLQVDFRPPSAVAKRGGVVGSYYTLMFDQVHQVLDNLQGEFGTFTNGYQIVGFGWHQGWNDRITTSYANAYEENMVDFINDIRAEFGNASLPVVIGTTGMEPNPNPSILNTVEEAQLAVGNPALYPAFSGTVESIDTRGFWRDSSLSPVSQGFHWNQNGESYFLIGDAMGEKMVDLLSP